MDPQCLSQPGNMNRQCVVLHHLPCFAFQNRQKDTPGYTTGVIEKQNLQKKELCTGKMQHFPVDPYQLLVKVQPDPSGADHAVEVFQGLVHEPAIPPDRDGSQSLLAECRHDIAVKYIHSVGDPLHMKNELQRLFGLPYEKINVVANGVNMNLFNGVERDYDFRRKYAMDNEKIILFMGRLVYEKGVQHLISAMPKILEGYRDSKLVICGKGGMLEELKQQVDAMGIANKVYFAGYLGGKEVQKMYKIADISVFPSTYEPFGIVALEAMLSENPIVVSDIGGLNEIVEHRVNGMKAYCGNANSIADSILELLHDHKLCSEITKKAKNKVRNQYNWSKIAQDTHFTYQKAICQSMAEKQKRELEQERARKTKKAKNTEKEITNLLNFKKRQAYA